MTRSEEVNDEFKHLQCDWSCSKNWSPQGHRSAGTEIISLMDSSTRELISSLQKYPSSSSGWKVRTNDLAIKELIKERRAAIESGILKGRRLFDSLEDGGELGFQEEERCSACSSIMIHGSEVRSLCSYSSCDDDADTAENSDDGHDGSGVCVGNVEREMMVNVDKKGALSVGIVDRLWWMLRKAWIPLGVVVFALFIFSWRSVDDRQHGEISVPT